MSFSAIMCAPAFSSSLGKRRIVFQVVFRPGGIEDVARVADRRFADLVLLGDRVHRDAHVVDPVQAVEDAEDVDAALGRLADEIFDDIVGIVLVADAVGAAQQHLQQQVRRILAHLAQTLPRVFGQEAHRDVEGRAAPAFEREQVRQRTGIGAGDAGDVDRCARGWRAATGGRRAWSCRSSARASRPRTHSANFFGPSSSSICLVPRRSRPVDEGHDRLAASALGGRARPLASGWPLTVTSAR